MARNTNSDDSDKSDAAQTLDSLNVGDVIRLPNHYSNALAVVETTAIGVRVEFVDDSLAARGTSKNLIRSKFTGEYGLVAGTSDKGTVWTVEVVARVADDEDDEQDTEEETPVETDGGEDEQDDEDLVEFRVQFETPVTAEDLYETFQNLADAAAAEGEEFEDVDDDVLPDGGSPVDSASAFENALQSFVEEAIVDGVHPSDASTLLFAEANRIAEAMWSHDRDDAEILP